MARLTFVSSDSHAGVPKERWADYLDREHHHLLPGLREDNQVYPAAIYLLSARKRAVDLPDVTEAHRSGYHGLHDPELRLADMDRDGVAAELIYHGDFRLGDLFHNNTNRAYPLAAWEAGVRAWNRWAADTFGSAKDRFLVVSPIGPCTDMEQTVRELKWISDHGFVGTYAPGYMVHPDLPSLTDDYWEPFWSTCEDRNLALVVHAGYGWDQGVVFPQLQNIFDQAATAAGATDFDSLLAHADTVGPEAMAFFGEFSGSPRPRRAMWQLMLGGVFDRHPRLKLLLTEVRADWVPATLSYLDQVYDQRRDELPASRKPSEYWQSNCLAGASFIHKAEVEMRDQIGVEQIAFGRDYPHPEGTWPHTREWLRDAFGAVSEPELRLMLGENLIGFLGLDGPHLDRIAARIGLTVEDVQSEGAPVPPELIANFDLRGGYLKPAEGAARLEQVDSMLQPDLAVVGARH
jgi:predicted TIM-barrel fold metal-dependent hydrolase